MNLEDFCKSSARFPNGFQQGNGVKWCAVSTGICIKCNVNNIQQKVGIYENSDGHDDFIHQGR